MTLRLAELTADNLPAGVKMPLEPGQERFVAPVVEPAGLEAFSRACGFDPTGEVLFGEVVGAKSA